MTKAGRPRILRVVVPAVCSLVLLAGCGTDRADHAAPPAPARAGLDLTALPACPAVPHVKPRADGLPPLELGCLGSGPAVRLSDLRGTPMVLNIWAAWCTNCADEAPLFQTLHRKAGDRLRFFGLHYKAQRAFGLQAARDFGVFYPSVHDADGDRTVRALHTTAPPQTLFVAADGRIAGRHIGVLTSQQQLDTLVARYLGVTV